MYIYFSDEHQQKDTQDYVKEKINKQVMEDQKHN